MRARCRRRARRARADRASASASRSERAAHGLLGVASRQHGARDPDRLGRAGPRSAQFTLMPFGGAGPLHARDVAASLGIRRDPGAGGARHPLRPGPRGLRPEGGFRAPASGCRSTRPAERAIRELVARSAPAGGALVRARGRCRRRRAGSSSAWTCATSARTSSSRSGSTSRTCPMPPGCAGRFFAAHETAYGYHNPHDPVEVVNVRLTARGRLHRRAAAARRAAGAARRGRSRRRAVCFDPDQPVDDAGLRSRRAEAGAGDRRAGGDRAARRDDPALPGRPRARRRRRQPPDRARAMTATPPDLDPITLEILLPTRCARSPTRASPR